MTTHCGRRPIVPCLFLIVLFLGTAVRAETCYVDAIHGDDGNTGTTGLPWRTLKRASRGQYTAGDALLLGSGQTFQGTLSLDEGSCPGSSGSNPLTVSTDGCAGTGQEILGGSYVAKTADPGLVDPYASEDLLPRRSLVELRGCRLGAGSPMIDAGTDLESVYGLPAGDQDFFGNRLPPIGRRFDIGAHERPDLEPLPAEAVSPR